MELKFKHFLLNEDATYLSARIGDILNGIQDVQENSEGMGTRQLVQNSEKIVNQIKRILHTHWGNDNIKRLESLQRVGVAIMKAIEEKSDLKETLGNSATEIQKTLADMGVPINTLGDQGDQETPQDPNQTAPPQGEEPEQQPQQPQQPQQQSGPTGGMDTGLGNMSGDMQVGGGPGTDVGAGSMGLGDTSNAAF